MPQLAAMGVVRHYSGVSGGGVATFNVGSAREQVAECGLLLLAEAEIKFIEHANRPPSTCPPTQPPGLVA